jgi:ABC-type Fe3+-hydroxamate transport system substrate-binding protein
MYTKVKNELIERYQQTGKIGFTKPATEEEAYQIIETLAQVFERDEEVAKEVVEETVINLSDITERLRNFFKNFN